MLKAIDEDIFYRPCSLTEARARAIENGPKRKPYIIRQEDISLSSEIVMFFERTNRDGPPIDLGRIDDDHKNDRISWTPEHMAEVVDQIREE